MKVTRSNLDFKAVTQAAKPQGALSTLRGLKFRCGQAQASWHSSSLPSPHSPPWGHSPNK